jgi:hypothetical protein
MYFLNTENLKRRPRFFFIFLPTSAHQGNSLLSSFVSISVLIYHLFEYNNPCSKEKECMRKRSKVMKVRGEVLGR